MTILITIAVHSFRDILRSRILYTVLAYAGLVMLLAVLAGQWTIGAEERFITDVGLTAMLGMGLLLILTRGAETLYREVDRKTVLVMLARPVHRWQFVAGNFLGMALVLFLLVLCLLAVLLLILAAMGVMPSAIVAGASWGVFLELLMISGVALLVSNLSSAVLATLISLFVFLAGHMASSLHTWIYTSGDHLGAHLPPSMQSVAEAYQTGPVNLFLKVSYYLLPNMEHVNFKMYAADAMPIPSARLVLGTLYAVVYALAAVWIAVAVFSRRDLS